MRTAAGGLLLVCLGLLAGACGSGPATSGAGGLSGGIVLDGAPEVAAVSEYAAEEFVRSHPDVRVRVDRSTQREALRRLCRGEVDVVHATRGPGRCPPEPGGRTVELRVVRVAVDGLAVVAHPVGPRPRCMTVADVRRLTGSAPEARTTIGGRAVRVFGVDRARTFPALDTRREDSRVFPPDDGAIGSAVAAQPGAIGFVGAGWLATQGMGLRDVGIAERGGCVRPTAASIRTGRYRSLTRPVLLVFRDDIARSARAHALLRFTVSGEAGAVESALLFAGSAEDLRRAEQIVG